MNIPWRTIIWHQFGAAIDDLGNASATVPTNCGALVYTNTPRSGRSFPSSGTSPITRYSGSTFTSPGRGRLRAPCPLRAD